MMNLYLEIDNLNQGIAYYFFVAAINAAGFQSPFGDVNDSYIENALQCQGQKVWG